MTIEVIDADAGETIYADSRAEAIAIAIADAQPGDEITIHDEDCACDNEGDGCTCAPTVMVVGQANEA